MKIIQKDADVLIFEENPASNPNKVLFILPVIGVILSHLNSQVDISAALIEIIEIEAILCFFFSLFFLFRKLYPVKITINKSKDNLVIDNLNLFFYFTSQPQTIQVKKIKEIFYYPWSLITTSAWTRSSMVFVLDDESKITINLPDNILFFKNYENIGKKIAEFIQVPFTM